jgi:predicted type IV restriction endonuclease
MDTVIKRIRNRLQTEGYPNEGAVRQSAVYPLLRKLGWDIDDDKIVYPEYGVPGGRVDVALCHPPARPKVLIEIKQVGLSAGAEPQLFQYAFHNGNPMVILTDGSMWNFYLPGEQGSYEERKVCTLDLIHQEILEIIEYFQRYLNYGRVKSGEAYQNAKLDYQHIVRTREAKSYLSEAWQQLVLESNENLIEVLASKVEDLCEIRPDSRSVLAFLRENIQLRENEPPKAVRSPKFSLANKPKIAEPPSQAKEDLKNYSFVLNNKFYQGRNARDVMIKIFEAISDTDPNFLMRFEALPKHGNKRRYLARRKEELYPDRPDLGQKESYQVRPGWWIGTNYNEQNILKIIQMACDVANLKLGEDLKVKLS